MSHFFAKFKTFKITCIEVILVSKWRQKLNWDDSIKNEEQLTYEPIKIININIEIEIA
jgi:hypothetical protein